MLMRLQRHHRVLINALLPLLLGGWWAMALLQCNQAVAAPHAATSMPSCASQDAATADGETDHGKALGCCCDSEFCLTQPAEIPSQVFHGHKPFSHEAPKLLPAAVNYEALLAHDAPPPPLITVHASLPQDVLTVFCILRI